MNQPLTLISLPLFPLQNVLFPGGRLALRVSEQRYRFMMHGCLETGAPCGVVTIQPEHPGQLHGIGTLAQIEAIAPLGPGQELVQCTGRERFRITATHLLPHGLRVADVELLPSDQPVTVPPDLQHVAQALQRVLRHLPPQQLPAQAPSPALLTQCGWVANRWCELFPLELQLQLQLLALDSPLLRLELIADALERAGIVSSPAQPQA